MIARRIDRGRFGKDRAATGSSFARLARYIANPGKLASAWAHNCLSSPTDVEVDWEMATLEVAHTQRVYTGPGKEPTYHLLLSFPEGEHLPDRDLHDIEQRYARALGYEEHQRLVAVHKDTDNLHLHVAINRVHPHNNTLHTPFRNFVTLEKCRLEVEAAYGLQPNPERTHTLSTGAADKEAHTYEQSFERQVRACREEIVQASATATVDHHGGGGAVAAVPSIVSAGVENLPVRAQARSDNGRTDTGPPADGGLAAGIGAPGVVDATAHRPGGESRQGEETSGSAGALS